MKETNESARTRTPAHSNATDHRALPAAKVFAILLGGLVVAFASIAASRFEPREEPGAAQSQSTNDSFALTDAEAIERFYELSELVFRSVRDRDLSLISEVFTAGGPMSDRASRVIRKLLNDDVLDKTRVERRQVRLLENKMDEIRIREVSVLFPCFEKPSGRDVTDADASFKDTILWILRRENSAWKVHDTVIEKERVLDGDDAVCP